MSINKTQVLGKIDNLKHNVFCLIKDTSLENMDVRSVVLMLYVTKIFISLLCVAENAFIFASIKKISQSIHQCQRSLEGHVKAFFMPTHIITRLISTLEMLSDSYSPMFYCSLVESSLIEA